MRRGLVCLFVLVFASVATATHVNVVLQATPPAGLDPLHPDCYVPGEITTVDVYYESFFDVDLQIRLSQFSNMGMTFDCEYDPFITPFAFDGDTFPFDAAFYAVFPDWPLPSAAYTGTSWNEMFGFGLAAGATAHVGSFDFQFGDCICDLPECPWDPDCKLRVLDIINVNGENPDFTGRIRADFDPVIDLTPMNGGLTGGTIDLCCIPEPASLALLGLGMLAVLRRR